MKAKLLLPFFLFLTVGAFAQEEFSFELYFEDAMGYRDTVRIGYDSAATSIHSGFDTMFGEEDLTYVPWSDSFEVRIIAYPDMYENVPSTKKIIQKRCGQSWMNQPSIHFQLRNVAYPVSVFFDTTGRESECAAGGVLNAFYISGWYDVGDYSEGEIIWALYNNDSMYFDSTYINGYDIDNDTIGVLWFMFEGTPPPDNYVNQLSSTNFVTFPNPFYQTFRYSADVPVTSIQLRDLQGKEIKLEQNENEITPLDCSSGVYILSYKIDKKTYYQKLIKK